MSVRLTHTPYQSKCSCCAFPTAAGCLPFGHTSTGKPSQLHGIGEHASRLSSQQHPVYTPVTSDFFNMYQPRSHLLGLLPNLSPSLQMLNTEDTPPQQLPQCQQRYFRCDRIECSADDITDQAISREITPSCSIESRLSSDFTSLSSDERDKGITNVFVDGLPSHADGEWLRKTFAPFGLIIAAKVMLSLKTTYSLGYGFVQYTKPEMADHAMQSMHDVEVDGYRLTVMIAHRDKNKGISHQPSHQVDVYNLPLSCSPLNVYILFAQFGSIRSVTRLPESSNHIDDGMVWRIHYTMVENAIAAVSQLNARLLQGHDRPLELKFIRQHRKSKHHLYPSKHLDTAALE